MSLSLSLSLCVCVCVCVCMCESLIHLSVNNYELLHSGIACQTVQRLQSRKDHLLLLTRLLASENEVMRRSDIRLLRPLIILREANENLLKARLREGVVINADIVPVVLHELEHVRELRVARH